MVPVPAAELTLSDGRRLAYRTMGAPAGPPLVVLHGTPGSWRQLAFLRERASARGITLVVPDRAGYGGSTYNPSATIASGARDVGELITHLGVDGCAVVGLSGGGPTALACGALPPGRVRVVATVGGVGPLVPRDGRLPPDRLVTRTARRSRTRARVLFAAMLGAGRLRPDQALDRFAGLLAEPDARLLRDDAEVRAAFLDDIRHPSPTAARAAAHEFWLFTHEWDVDPAAVAVPAHIWHGDQDRNVPVAHAHVIADRCPTADLHVVTGGGHLLLTRLDDILAALTEL